MSSRLNERYAVLGVVNPAVYPVGTVDTAVIDAKHFRRVAFLLLAGNLSGGGVVDFKVQSADDPGGAFADVPGTAITPMNNADGTNHQAVVEVTADWLPDGHRYLRGRVTVSTAAAPVAVAALGGDARYEPVAPFNYAGVTRVSD